jgi:hypothetical protein
MPEILVSQMTKIHEFAAEGRKIIFSACGKSRLFFARIFDLRAEPHPVLLRGRRAFSAPCRRPLEQNQTVFAPCNPP